MLWACLTHGVDNGDPYKDVSAIRGLEGFNQQAPCDKNWQRCWANGVCFPLVSKNFDGGIERSRFWGVFRLGVVSPHLPGEIFRAISVIFSQCESIFRSFSVNFSRFFPRFLSVLVNFSQFQSALVDFSQF